MSSMQPTIEPHSSSASCPVCLGALQGKQDLIASKISSFSRHVPNLAAKLQRLLEMTEGGPTSHSCEEAIALLPSLGGSIPLPSSSSLPSSLSSSPAPTSSTWASPSNPRSTSISSTTSTTISNSSSSSRPINPSASYSSPYAVLPRSRSQSQSQIQSQSQYHIPPAAQAVSSASYSPTQPSAGLHESPVLWQQKASRPDIPSPQSSSENSRAPTLSPCLPEPRESSESISSEGPKTPDPSRAVNPNYFVHGESSSTAPRPGFRLNPRSSPTPASPSPIPLPQLPPIVPLQSEASFAPPFITRGPSLLNSAPPPHHHHPSTNLTMPSTYLRSPKYYPQPTIGYEITTPPRWPGWQH